VVTETYLGRAEVRNTFLVIRRQVRLQLLRGRWHPELTLMRCCAKAPVIYTSKLNSLKRSRMHASEVSSLVLNAAQRPNFNDIKVAMSGNASA